MQPSLFEMIPFNTYLTVSETVTYSVTNKQNEAILCAASTTVHYESYYTKHIHTKAINEREKLPVRYHCVAGFRLVNTKCMSDIELWKKILHPNLVHLREVFTTKAFGDNCMYLPLPDFYLVV